MAFVLPPHLPPPHPLSHTHTHTFGMSIHFAFVSDIITLVVRFAPRPRWHNDYRVHNIWVRCVRCTRLHPLCMSNAHLRERKREARPKSIEDSWIFWCVYCNRFAFHARTLIFSILKWISRLSCKRVFASNHTHTNTHTHTYVHLHNKTIDMTLIHVKKYDKKTHTQNFLELTYTDSTIGRNDGWKNNQHETKKKKIIII